MDRYELAAVGKSSLDLNFSDHFGNARHDLIAPEKFSTEVHQFGDGAPIANEFEELCRDERHAFGVIQAHSAREAFLGEKAGIMKMQFVDVARGKMHRSPFTKPRV